MFILASASPRRRALLEQIGAVFRVEESAVEEVREASDAAELVRINAERKARDIAAKNSLPVLGADTVVVLDGRIFGKPQNGAEARMMLRTLSGRAHEVLTGIAWIREGKIVSAVSRTLVHFALLGEEEIERYVLTGEPLGKAGAYAVQGGAAVFVERLEGSFSNVVGLPLHDTAELAKKAGVDLYGGHGA